MCIKQAGFDKIILAVVLLSNGQGQPLMGASTASAVHQELHQGVRTDRQTDRWTDTGIPIRLLTGCRQTAFTVLIFYKLTLADNKNASKESRCIYWEKENLQISPWWIEFAKRVTYCPRAPALQALMPFRTSGVYSHSTLSPLPTDFTVSWDAEHLSAVRTWQRSDGKWGIILHPLF